MFTKLILLGLAILVSSVLEALFDRVMKVDFSSIPRSKMIIHDVMQTLSGAILGAIILTW